jgi:hypothetical protein
MDPRRTRPAHQHVGDASSSEGARRIGGDTCKPTGATVHGQHLGSLLHQQAGGNSLATTVSFGERLTDETTQPAHRDESRTHPRMQERAGRLTVQIGKNHINGVDTTSRDIQATTVPVGDPTDRPVRNEIQLSATDILLAVPGRESSRSRRTVTTVGPNIRIRVSSDNSTSKSSAKDKGIVGQSTSDSSCMDNQILVPIGTRASRRPSMAASTVGKAPKAAKIAGVLQQRRNAGPSRLAIVRRSLATTGFSNEVAKRISARNRSSTSKVYQSRWEIFSKWCKHRKVDPLQASIPCIADFLLSLYEKDFQIGSIKGYKSAISSTLIHQGRRIGIDKDLIDLIRSLAKDRPSRPRNVPTWDLSLVLHVLNGDIFEPLSSVDMKFLAYKTAFLLALATASRVSEIHAIDVDSIRFGENYKDVSFCPELGFLAKTQNPEDTQRALAMMNIKSLCETLDDRMSDDMKLCPIRALRYYLRRTKEQRSTKKLFLSTLAPFQGITAQTLSKWIKDTVHICYARATDGNRAHAQIRAHDLRGFATTWAFRNNVKLLDILKAGTWKRHTTFTDFYLKDLTSLQEGLRSLGTLSVAQHKV